VNRALRLYVLSIKAFFHRLRHDLGRELTVLVSSLVLFATFLYVFNDFLNVQVLSLSPAMRDHFAVAAAGTLNALAILWSARLIRYELYGTQSFRQAATVLGENRATLRRFLLLRSATTILVVDGLALAATRHWLVPLPPVALAACGVIMACLTIAGAAWRGSGREHLETRRELLPSGGLQAPVRALLVWRLGQILGRNRLTRLCCLLAVLFAALVPWAGARGAPPFVAAVAALAAGLLVAWALAFQLQEDMQNVWTERGLGVTHTQFVAAYERLALLMGSVLALATALLYLAAGSFWQTVHPGLLNDAARVFAVGLIPAWSLPMIMFQIDARKPAINMLLTLLVGLFVGTAVYASWLGLLLVPILRYYALQSQAGRFYRA